jgi:hypothetical protein
MNYPDRRFLFPVVAATAWAQQPAPAVDEVEAALRARVEQFYQLQVDKKFRQAEALVAEESKDDYYNRAKPDIKGFSIQEIHLSDNNTRARVTLKGKLVFKIPQLGTQAFEMPMTTSWKMEDGQWFWFIDPELSGQTPFGKTNFQAGKAPADSAGRPPVKIDVATLMNQVTLDSTSVILNASNPVQTITVSNNLPGEVNLELTNPQLEGVSIEVERSTLKAGEKSAIRFRRTSEAKSSGLVSIVASPLNKVFDIRVRSN